MLLANQLIEILEPREASNNASNLPTNHVLKKRVIFYILKNKILYFLSLRLGFLPKF